jgi:Co/Zn/Cd efflux system component
MRADTEILDQVRSSPDTTVKAALFEDSAAMVGLGLAALGLALRQVTGSPVWDGAASIAIGGLLVAVAFRLGLDSRDYLIGRAAGPKDLEVIRAEIENAAGVAALLDLRTMHLGPDHLIVAAQGGVRRRDQRRPGRGRRRRRRPATRRAAHAHPARLP